MSPFKEKVIQVIQSIPAGKVMSYSQIAAYVGLPKGARMIGGWLRSMEGAVDIPWWRVINNAGEITIKGNFYNDKEMQRKLLRAEGIEVTDEFTLDMRKYRFIPDKLLLTQFSLDAEYITKLEQKYTV